MGPCHVFSEAGQANDGHRALQGRGAAALERSHTQVQLSCGSIGRTAYENRATSGTSIPQRSESPICSAGMKGGDSLGYRQRR
jgi:hypothetical protein